MYLIDAVLLNSDEVIHMRPYYPIIISSNKCIFIGSDVEFGHEMAMGYGANEISFRVYNTKKRTYSIKSLHSVSKLLRRGDIVGSDDSCVYMMTPLLWNILSKIKYDKDLGRVVKFMRCINDRDFSYSVFHDCIILHFGFKTFKYEISCDSIVMNRLLYRWRTQLRGTV